MRRNLIRIFFFLPLFILSDARAVDTSRLTAQDLEVFLEGIMPLQLEREDIAGAVISVVKDGEMIFAKGYGFADVKQKKPVSPDSTLFRPGSVSKLFIWTAVMQLVEQGKLDLDRDVS
jgi:CubicO group peptidase (beta-lactamase class C family)